MLLPELGQFPENYDDSVLEGAKLYENDVLQFHALRDDLSLGDTCRVPAQKVSLNTQLMLSNTHQIFQTQLCSCRCFVPFP